MLPGRYEVVIEGSGSGSVAAVVKLDPRVQVRNPGFSRADYEEQYRRATDRAVAAGVVLAEDRDALAGFSDPERLPG